MTLGFELRRGGPFVDSFTFESPMDVWRIRSLCAEDGRGVSAWLEVSRKLVRGGGELLVTGREGEVHAVAETGFVCL